MSAAFVSIFVLILQFHIVKSTSNRNYNIMQEEATWTSNINFNNLMVFQKSVTDIEEIELKDSDELTHSKTRGVLSEIMMSASESDSIRPDAADLDETSPEPQPETTPDGEDETTAETFQTTSAPDFQPETTPEPDEPETTPDDEGFDTTATDERTVAGDQGASSSTAARETSAALLDTTMPAATSSSYGRSESTAVGSTSGFQESAESAHQSPENHTTQKHIVDDEETTTATPSSTAARETQVAWSSTAVPATSSSYRDGDDGLESTTAATGSAGGSDSGPELTADSTTKRPERHTSDRSINDEETTTASRETPETVFSTILPAMSSSYGQDRAESTEEAAGSSGGSERSNELTADITMKIPDRQTSERILSDEETTSRSTDARETPAAVFSATVPATYTSTSYGDGRVGLTDEATGSAGGSDRSTEPRNDDKEPETTAASSETFQTTSAPDFQPETTPEPDEPETTPDDEGFDTTATDERTVAGDQGASSSTAARETSAALLDTTMPAATSSSYGRSESTAVGSTSGFQESAESAHQSPENHTTQKHIVDDEETTTATPSSTAARETQVAWSSTAVPATSSSYRDGDDGLESTTAATGSAGGSDSGPELTADSTTKTLEHQTSEHSINDDETTSKITSSRETPAALFSTIVPATYTTNYSYDRVGSTEATGSAGDSERDTELTAGRTTRLPEEYTSKEPEVSDEETKPKSSAAREPPEAWFNTTVSAPSESTSYGDDRVGSTAAATGSAGGSERSTELTSTQVPEQYTTIKTIVSDEDTTSGSTTERETPVALLSTFLPSSTFSRYSTPATGSADGFDIRSTDPRGDGGEPGIEETSSSTAVRETPTALLNTIMPAATSSSYDQREPTTAAAAADSASSTEVTELRSENTTHKPEQYATQKLTVDDNETASSIATRDTPEAWFSTPIPAAVSTAVSDNTSSEMPRVSVSSSSGWKNTYESTAMGESSSDQAWPHENSTLTATHKPEDTAQTKADCLDTNQNSSLEVQAMCASSVVKSVTTLPLTSQVTKPNSPYLVARRPAVGMPGRSVSIQLEIANVAWIQFDSLTLSSLNLETQQGIPCELKLLSRTSDNNSLIVNATLFGPGGLDGVVLISLGVVQVESPIIIFNFTFFSSSTLKIIDISPKSTYVYSRPFLTLTMLNLPEKITCENVLCDFQWYGMAECISIDFEYDGEILKSTLVLRIPRVVNAGEFLPSLTFVMNNETKPVNVIFAFTYLDPPQPFVNSVTPLMASISTSTTISLSIRSFPPVDGLNQIVAVFTWPDSSKHTQVTVKELISYSELPNSMLNINIGSPEGNSARSGRSILTIYHVLYPNYTASFDGFLFVDNSNPQVSQLQLIGFSPVPDILRVPMGKSQTIFISVDDAPVNFDEMGCTAQIEGNSAKLVSSAYKSESRSATLVLEVWPALSAGFKYGLLVFSNPQTSCSSLCCANNSCHESAACGEAKTACFVLEYFDDTLPRISNRYKSFGYRIL